jgi:hypothetical protein
VANYHTGSSEPSNTVQITTPLPIYNPPRNLQAAMQGNQVRLQWEAPVGSTHNVFHYNIYRNGSFQSTATSLSTLTSGNVGQTNTFHVTAVYAHQHGPESVPSNSVQITIPWMMNDNIPE